MFERLGLHWIDLLPAITGLAEAGADLGEEPGDRWHPNDVAALHMASFALGNGLLGDAQRRTLLAVDRYVVAAMGDEAQTLTIDGGAAAAGCTYFVLGSATGTDPGAPLADAHLWLNPDAYMNATAHAPAWITPSQGRLDGEGRARAAIRLAPALRAACAGQTLHHACIVADLERREIKQVSLPVPLMITK